LKLFPAGCVAIDRSNICIYTRNRSRYSKYSCLFICFC